MDKKLLVSAIAGSIAYFLLGWLVFGIALENYYMNNMTTYDGLMREEPIMTGIFLGGLVWSVMLAYVFTRFANVNNFSRGFTVSLILGFLIVLGTDLMLYSTMKLYRATLLAVDVVVNSLFIAVVGGIIGWVIGMTSKRESAAVA